MLQRLALHVFPKRAAILHKVVSVTLLLCFTILALSIEATSTIATPIESVVLRVLFTGVALLALLNLLKRSITAAIALGVLTAITSVVRLAWLVPDGYAVASVVWVIVAVAVPMATAVAFFLDEEINKEDP